jgi:hypothetical protein
MLWMLCGCEWRGWVGDMLRMLCDCGRAPGFAVIDLNGTLNTTRKLEVPDTELDELDVMCDVGQGQRYRTSRSIVAEASKYDASASVLK